MMLPSLSTVMCRLSLILSALTLCYAAADSPREVTVVIMEEEPAGVKVIDLSTHSITATIIGDTQHTGIGYQILGGSDYFTIDTESGEITTKTRIDRETVCVPGVELCIVDLDIMMDYAQQFSIFKIKIQIEDIDDNIPVFSAPTSVTLNVTEGDNLNLTLSLPIAIDLDTAHNIDTAYHLIKPDNLPQSVGISLMWNVANLYLVISGNIDRETVAALHFTVQSFTPTQSDRRSSLDVTMNILDINDNTPVFTAHVYRIRVSERLSSGSVIGQVTASDADSSDRNSRVCYKLESGADNTPITVDNQTGELTLTDRLDYEVATAYTLAVTAYNDEGAPAGNMVARCMVYVTVIDENDHAPHIRITTVGDDSTARIAEHSPVDTFVAHISVTDSDSASPNNNVICELNSSSYSLNSLPATGIEYTITVNSDIDRESTLATGNDVTVTCTDLGYPPITTEVIVKIELEDINDHAPQFSAPVHHVYDLAENSPRGSFVISLLASDLDTGANSKIQYTITDRTDGYTVLPFKVDSETGEVTVSGSLDHETESEYVFTVTASDGGIPSLKSMTTVYIHLVELNDNPPVFVQTTYHVKFAEELHPLHVTDTIGMVVATDADQKGTAKVWYSLQDGKDNFKIGHESGVLRIINPVDREEIDRYQLTVLATDFGVPALTATAQVFIEIEDINDNRPVFRDISNQTYELSYQSKVGSSITVVSATDADSSDLNKLEYSIRYPENSIELFAVDRNTGRLYLARPLDQHMIGSYTVTVIVTDSALHKDSVDVNVVVSEQTIQDTDKQKTKTHHIIIYCVMSAVIVAVVIGAVVVVMRLKNKKSKDMRIYNCRIATQSRFDDSMISSRASDRSSKDLISNFTDVSHAYHHTRISDRSQVVSMCDGSGCDNHIVPSYIKEGARLPWAQHLNGNGDSGCESIASPLSISLLKQGNRASTFINTSAYQPPVAIKHLVSYDMEMSPSIVSEPTTNGSQSSDTVITIPVDNHSIPYADDSSDTQSDDSDTNTSADVFSIDDLSSDYDDSQEQHSGNCDICLDNSTITWSHTHDNCNSDNDYKVPDTFRHLYGTPNSSGDTFIV